MSTTSAERKTDEETKSSGGVSLRLISSTLWRHPFAFAGVLILTACAAAGVWFFLPVPKLTAAVVFHIASQPQAILAPTAESRIDFPSYRQSQVALLKSRRTLNAALKSNEAKNLQIVRNASPDELTWLDKAITIDPRSGTELLRNNEYLRITIEGDNETELLTLLNALAKAYKTATFERDNDVKIWRLEELERTFAQRKAETRKDYQARDEIAFSLGSIDALQLANIDSDNREELRLESRRLSTLRADLKLAESYASLANLTTNRKPMLAITGSLAMATLADGKSLIPEYVSQSQIEDALSRDPVCQELEAVASKARRDLIFTENRAEPDSEPVRRAREKVKIAEENLDKHQQKVRQAILSKIRERGSPAGDALPLALQGGPKYLQVQIEACTERIANVRQRIDKHSKYKLQLDSLQFAIAQKEKLTTTMGEEIERLKVELNSPSRVSVSEEPFIVPGIEGNRRKKYSLLAALAVLITGLAGLVGWEYRSRRVTHADEVSSTLGARLIGTIPPLVPMTSGEMPDAAHESLVEAIDTARIMLTHGSPNGANLRVLMVTSAVSGEGKTTLSGHLAISLTRAGFRTLLVDGDMHAPSAHTLFDITDSPGLSELLRGDAALSEAIRPTPIPGLSVLPAGRWNMATRQTLVGDRWRILRRELGSMFDFIVIDTSPLLMVSDTMLLAREADGVVLSVLLGVSQISRVAETVSRLQAVGAELAGVVVNNVQSEVSRRYGSRIKPSASLLPFGEPLPETVGVDGVRKEA